MADPVTTPPAPPRGPQAKPPGAGGKLLSGKVAGIPKPVLVFGVAAGGALVFLWWRDRKAKAGGQPTATASSFATSTASAFADSEASQLAGLQSELAGLIAQQTAGSSPGTSTATSPAGSTASKPKQAPGFITATAVTGNSAELTCGALDRATSYRFRVWESTKAHPVVVDHTGNGNRYKATGLKPGQKYGCHAAGVDKSGQGPYTGTHYFTTTGAGHLVHPDATTNAAGTPS